MSTSLLLALKYLKLRRSAVSVITLISVLGVLLGVAVLIIVLAVMTGFTDLMKNAGCGPAHPPFEQLHR